MDLMKGLPDGSVDMVLCDLPYGTTRNKWDTVIPLAPLWEQYKRVVKENGAILLFACEPFASLLRTSNMRNYKYDWVWKKGRYKTGHLNAHRRPLFCIENILVFNATTYNPQGLIPLGEKVKRGGNGGCYGYSNTENYQAFTNYPTQFLDFPRDVEHLHSTQKPVALCEYLIQTYTNPRDTVLDNAMGSGTTGIACIKTGRRFIGIEKDPKIFAQARCRILDAAGEIFARGLKEAAP